MGLPEDAAGVLGVAKDGLFPRHRTRRWTGCLHKGRDLCSPPLTQAVKTFRQQDVGFRLGDGMTSSYEGHFIRGFQWMSLHYTHLHALHGPRWWWAPSAYLESTHA